MMMTSKEALEYLSKNDFVSVAVGMGTNKQKHLEAYKVIKQDLEELESIKSCLADYGLDITNLREMCMYYKMREKKY